MGWVASFIPASVMRGFIEGLVYVTIIGQVPHLLGISGASGNFFTKLWHISQHLQDVSLAPALTGILCLTAMLLFRYLARQSTCSYRLNRAIGLDGVSFKRRKLSAICFF